MLFCPGLGVDSGEVLVPEAVIVATARSPIGRAFKGSLKDLRPDDLAATIVQAALDKVPELDPGEIDDLMLGCGLPGGEQGFNMARVVAVLLGRDDLPGTTITRYCASSLQTTRMAFHAIKAGEGDVFVSAGVEMVSRFGKGNSDSLPDTMNPLFDDAQQRTAELAQAEGGRLVRPAPPRPAARRLHRDGSDRRERRPAQGRRAPGAGRVRRPVAEPRREGDRRRLLRARDHPGDAAGRHVVDKDDGPRAGVTVEAMAGLKPVFRPDGTVTAGNACPLNDGAAALVIMSDSKAQALGVRPLARVVATGVTALSPEIMGYGPVAASRRALARAGMSINDIDLVEINEAFAAQVIPSYRDLGIDIDRLNVHGGAIALGHPFGMTGARITTTLINGLQTEDKTLGLETMCVGGGQGMAMIIERLS